MIYGVFYLYINDKFSPPQNCKNYLPPLPQICSYYFSNIGQLIITLMIFEKKMEKFTRNRQIYSPPPPTQNGLKNKKNKGGNYENEWKQCKMGGLGAGFSG